MVEVGWEVGALAKQEIAYQWLKIVVLLCRERTVMGEEQSFQILNYSIFEFPFVNQ